MKDEETNTLKHDPFDGELTFLGEIMSVLPISQECTRLIMFGYPLGVMREAVVIGTS